MFDWLISRRPYATSRYASIPRSVREEVLSLCRQQAAEAAALARRNGDGTSAQIPDCGCFEP
ncbi:hypothetical protein GQ651_04180 [Alphaproteobacteria bacterium GH1-50]|uniref:Uncharacterized protein n=1 Tax=Kangsaoukella pontilimi TaxID=2691042 RepID=A0A7C9NCY6_9RHOB|nr:hypothetical protein [Kangsaoukella pontilimi]MXQ07039.1 hypothetical protein [Kangsaoukella pontilimi]